MNQDEASSKKNYWEAVGKSACPDDIMRDMSITEISKYLEKGDSVLDLGCGNGFCSYEFAKSEATSILGIDYSSTSIDSAKEALRTNTSSTAKKLLFEQGDALNLSQHQNEFDKVITIRCIINVGDQVKMSKALSEIHRSLKPGGKYLMCENFISGLKNINESRSSIGLDEIQTRWHNTYIEDCWFKDNIEPMFTNIEYNHFLSSYFYVSRVVNAWTAKQRGEEPKYEDPMNFMASKLPPYGEHSPMRLLILTK